MNTSQEEINVEELEKKLFGEKASQISDTLLSTLKNYHEFSFKCYTEKIHEALSTHITDKIFYKVILTFFSDLTV